MKLSSLTPEQKTRLLAELDDDKPILVFDHTGNFTLDYLVEGEQFMRRKRRYDKSYDAIIPLVQKLDMMEQIVDLFWTLFGIGKDDKYQWELNATPSQLCDAVLVATGKAEL